MKAGIVLGFLAVIGITLFFSGALKSPSPLIIENAHARPIEGQTLVALMFNINNAGAPDRLLSVESSEGKTKIYNPASEGGLPVPTGTAALALDAAHVTLMPDQPIADGQLVPLALTFENAGRVTAKARLSDPAANGNAQEVGLFGIGGLCIVGDGEPAPELALSVKEENDGWRVSIDARDFTFSKDLLGLYHVPGTGHGHLYVGGMKLGRVFSNEAYVGALPKGTHEIRVTLNTNDHRAYVVDDTPVTASAIVVVN